MSREARRGRVRVAGEVRAVRLLEAGEDGPRQALVDRAHELGRQRGAAEAARAGVEGSARTLETATARLEELREELAGTAVELALGIARRLLRAEIPRGGHDVERIVRETLAEASADRAPCVVHLHPEDAQALGSVRLRSGTRIQADPGVSRGDVRVETSLGVLTRELDRMLEAIGERLAEEIG